MTTYRHKETGQEILVCDGCGIDPSGTKPDLTGYEPFDLDAEMQAAGFPAGTSATVTDTCPDCTQQRQKPSSGRSK